MENLFKDIQARLDFLDSLNEQEQKQEENKVFTIRLPLELLEKLDNIACVLQTTKTDVARMILVHGAQSIIDEYQIKVGEGHGISFADRYALETGEKTLEDVLKKEGN